MLTTITTQIEELKSLIINSTTNRWIGIKNACTIVSLSESTIRRAINKGELKVSRKTGKLLFRISDIEKWLNG